MRKLQGRSDGSDHVWKRGGGRGGGRGTRGTPLTSRDQGIGTSGMIGGKYL